MREIVRSLLRPPEIEAESLVDLAPVAGVRTVFRRFSPTPWPFRGRPVVGLVLSVLAPALEAAAIWVLKLVTDDVVIPRDISLFPELAAVFLGITVLAGIAGFADEYLANWIGENFLHRLADPGVRAPAHPVGGVFRSAGRLGDILSRRTEKKGGIEGFVLIGVAEATSEAFQIVIFAGVMFVISWQLVLVTLIAVPVFWLTARAFSRRIKAASREARRRNGSIGAVAEDSLGSAVLVQAYGREQAEAERFAGQSRAASARSSPPPGRSAVPVGRERAGGGGPADHRRRRGLGAVGQRLTVGGLVAFLVYLVQLFSPVRDLGELSGTIFGAAAGAERIIELLDERQAVTAPARPAAMSRARGMLALHDVGFRYPGTGADAVAGVSFAALPGQTTALVGASGAGKTTLIKLLLRFYDPARGQISLDGHDLRDLDPHNCAPTSPSCCKKPCCWTAPSRTTSWPAGPREPPRAGRGRPRRRRRRVHHRAAQGLRHPGSGTAGGCCPAGSARRGRPRDDP